MTLSPDGKFLWNGKEWIPAPPKIETATISNIANSSHVKQNISKNQDDQKKEQGSGAELISMLGFIFLILASGRYIFPDLEESASQYEESEEQYTNGCLHDQSYTNCSELKANLDAQWFGRLFASNGLFFGLTFLSFLLYAGLKKAL
tara:strand:- start:110 stop:550 length:441 start_codon:yes stop_codon:yes gene_type:complete